jgi:hypothetical protein
MCARARRCCTVLILDCTLEQLQAALTSCWCGLTALDIGEHGELAEVLCAQRVTGPVVPLTGPPLEGGPDGLETSVAHIGQWTGLMRLFLPWASCWRTRRHPRWQLSSSS